MPLDKSAARERIQQFDFSDLFTQELGWDRYRSNTSVIVAGRGFELRGVAEKRGFTVWHCPTPGGEKMPDSATRRRIEREATKAAHEHLIIFTDAAKSVQIWQWVRRELGKPLRLRETLWAKGQSGELLLQKLVPLFVSLDDEEAITLPEVSKRTAANVDERVTKKFFEEFRKQHAAFLKFITGIPVEGDHEWYASVMLNRLMFLYFIQRKGFLDGDENYLRNRLEKLRAAHGKDKFYTFYRFFLLKLFHGGLNAREQDREPGLEQLLGRVPYLNGGIFDIHTLERTYGDKIQIPDTAFTAIFDYFDRYQWHLDERPLRADNEINPDVLGYIFEKYINQKQMGAYYTKEDITEYIGKNTIIPFLFDKVLAETNTPFSALTAQLSEDPDRYIYPAVRHGISWAYQPDHPEKGEPLEKAHPLPPEIQVGEDTAKPDLRERRKAWNKPATPELGLPTEIWRETVARRQRYHSIRAQLARGLSSISDFITLNLDIRRFALDVIATADAPLLAAFWHALAGRPARKSNEKARPGITILDPTCGSGAFLFAALNLLQPLYEACLDRMESLLADAHGTKLHADSHLADFQRILGQVEKHPSERYFVFKTIILHNLYGVDLMEEAAEICKLRLFLKLAAQVEPDAADANLGIEPLPDIDFNIRSGNTLVGYATKDEVRKCMSEFGDGQMRLGVDDELNSFNRFAEKLENAASAYRLFREMQTGEGALDSTAFLAAKKNLRERLADLNSTLHTYLATDYGTKTTGSAFEAWKKSHQPFHWFVEFYGILSAGGFDVIIGNPPYVELKEVGDYKLKNYECVDAGNLYAVVMERCSNIVRHDGRQGYIVPVSSISTDRYESLQQLIRGREDWMSSFDDRPSRLFDGLEHIRLTIHILGNPVKRTALFSTRYNKWAAVERAFIFDNLEYTICVPSLIEGSFPKLASPLEAKLIAKVAAQKSQLCLHYSRAGQYPVYFSRKVGYFLQVLNFEPKVLDGNGKKRPPSEFKSLPFQTKRQADIALCCLNSNFFYWIITAFSDCRHVNKREVDAFPIDIAVISKASHGKDLEPLAKRLMADIQRNSEERIMKFKHDTLTVQCIYPKASKPIIDEIDTVLAEHYGFTPEELDYIVNYDIKYRLGRSADEEE